MYFDDLCFFLSLSIQWLLIFQMFLFAHALGTFLEAFQLWQPSWLNLLQTCFQPQLYSLLAIFNIVLIFIVYGVKVHNDFRNHSQLIIMTIIYDRQRRTSRVGQWGDVGQRVQSFSYAGWTSSEVLRYSMAAVVNNSVTWKVLRD